jgi:hypothetical protein
MRYPDKSQDSVGHSRISGGQVAYHIGDREKESLEPIDIKIHNPANSEISIRSDGRWKN